MNPGPDAPELPVVSTKLDEPALEPEITIAQAAQIKQVSTRTIRRWIAQGFLPAYRVGPTLVRIKRCDLDRLGFRIPAADC